MSKFLKNLTENWFHNSQNNAAIRHEFPLYNVTDGLRSIKDSTPPLVMDQKNINKSIQKDSENNQN